MATSKVDTAYELIRERILSGQYTPGYRLVLGPLAKELGSSAVPVREAIRRLEAEHLVQFERNVGATVRGLDPVEYRWTMETLAVVEEPPSGRPSPCSAPRSWTRRAGSTSSCAPSWPGCAAATSTPSASAS